MPSQYISVLIIGAGPTGLNLANLLAQYRISQRILDEKIEPIHTSNALVVQPRSLEMWDSLELAETAIALGKKIKGLTLGSLNKRIGEIDFAKIGLATPFPFILGIPQAESERILADNLVKNGITVERGLTLINFSETNDKISAQVQHPNGDLETVACDWLIAADGSHSVIRKKLKLNFQGENIAEKFIMLDAEISADINLDYFHAVLSPYGPVVFAPLRDFTRIICSVTDDIGIKDFTHPTLSDFEYIIQKRSRISCKINKSIWTSHFLTQHRLIDNYRYGRVIFAGDSAHIHSPVGGQGMNTGMQDGFNLAWKLARVIHGTSAIPLLDTYNFERRRIAKSVLSSTTKMTKIVTLKNPVLILLRNYLMNFILRFKKIKQAIAGNISELNLSYLSNAAVINNGKRAQDALLYYQDQPIQLRQLLYGLSYKLLIFTGKGYSTTQANDILQFVKWARINLADFAEPMIISSTIDYLTSEIIYLDKFLKAHRSYALENGGLCLVRPDQYIALSLKNINNAKAIPLLLLAKSKVTGKS